MTKRFAAAVAAINAADIARFPKLVAQLLKVLPEKVCILAPEFLFLAFRASLTMTPTFLAQGTASFSDEELAQLQELFGLTEEQLQLLLSGCT